MQAASGGPSWLSLDPLQSLTNSRAHPLRHSPGSTLRGVLAVTPVAQRLKRLPGMRETADRSLGREDPLEKEVATHSSIPAWRIPWREEPGGLQSVGSLGAGHDGATSLSLFTFMPWRRKWHPTPALLPGKSCGGRSLVGCRPRVAESRTRRSDFTFLLLALLGSPAWPPGPGAPQPGPAAHLPARTIFPHPLGPASAYSAARQSGLDPG